MINIIYNIYIYIYQYQYPWDLSKNALFHPIHGHPMGQKTTSMMVHHGSLVHEVTWLTFFNRGIEVKPMKRWMVAAFPFIAGWFMSWKISQQKWDDDWGYPHDNQKKCVCMVYHQPSRLLLICSSSLLNAAGVHVLGSHLWSQGNVLKCNGWYPLVI